MHVRLFAAVTAITCLAAVLPARAASAAERLPTVRLDYTIYAGGLEAMSLALRVRTDANGYLLQTRVRTIGFLSRVVPFVLEAATEGVHDGDALVPRSYATANRWRSKDIRRVDMQYRDGVVPDVTAVPEPEDDDRKRVPRDRRRETVDPLTAVFRLLLSGPGTCRGQAAVFDGRRRYDMTAERVGKTAVDSGDYGIYRGEATQCRLGVETITGFWNDVEERKRYPEAVKLWLGDAVEGGPPVPVRLEIDTDYVTVVGHLTQVRRGEAASLTPTPTPTPLDVIARSSGATDDEVVQDAR